MHVRAAEPSEIDAIAKLWYESWRDAHERIVPAELTRIRTQASFRERIATMLPSVRVVGTTGSPDGFSILKEDELFQLFVAAHARGSGIAAALIADAEARLAARGVATAWLTCAIGNERAARFYEKCGWHRAGVVVNRLESPQGEILLDVWRYEKGLDART